MTGVQFVFLVVAPMSIVLFSAGLIIVTRWIDERADRKPDD